MPIDHSVLEPHVDQPIVQSLTQDVLDHASPRDDARALHGRASDLLTTPRSTHAVPERTTSTPHDAATATQDALRSLHALLGSEQLERYFIGQARVQFVAGKTEGDAGTLVVSVATGLNAQIIERRFGSVLERVARTIDGRSSSVSDTPRVRYVVDRTAFMSSTPTTTAIAPTTAGVAAPAATPRGAQGAQAVGGARTSSPSPAPLAPRPASRPAAGLSVTGRYRLEDFLVGASNRLAFSAVRQLVDMPAQAASRAMGVQGLSHVFVHGGCGLGKTHLLQGAARRFLEQRPGSKVRYVTGEQFTNEFLTALRTSRIDQFRAAHRGVDLLCIDDVHFVANKDATQEELLHTLDAVGLAGARVLIASDAHPHHIAKLSQKLVGRFLSSAVVTIDTPDHGLRRQLIRHLAARRGMLLAPDAVELLAQRSERAMGAMHGFGGSVREIEGLVNQVDAVARLLDTTPSAGSSTPSHELSAHNVRRALGIDERAAQARATMPGKPVAVKAIVDHVCAALCVEATDFRGKCRHKRVVFARSVVAHLARELTTHSFPEIARAMGRDNHSTIITAQRRLVQQLATSSAEPVSPELAPMHTGCTLGELITQLGNESRGSGRV